MAAFKHVIVIGYGVVTGTVLPIVNEHLGKYGYSVAYIEHEVHPFNAAKKYAEANEVEYHVIEDKIELTNFFEKRAENSKLLIISASNNYLFSKHLVENDNVTIVNFHNALLPNFPGRNAPSWAIYECLKKTGITWHYVTSGVDEGDIIIQKECPIDDDIRAYELVAIQMKLAGEAFIECYEDILNESAKPLKQDICEKRRLYKSKEVPGGGIFDLEDKPEDIYRLLRAMDYGKNDIFPLPMTVYKEQQIRIRRYKKVSLAEKNDVENTLYIPYSADEYLMLRYDTVSASGEIRGVVDTLEYLQDMVYELKRANRRMQSNMVLREEELEEIIQQNELLYTYLPGKYLNVWFWERDFIRLYYYVSTIDEYKPFDGDEKIICEIYATKKELKTDSLIARFERNHFKKYSSYHRWVAKDLTFDTIGESSYSVRDDVTNGIYDGILTYFDVYGDHLPRESSLEEYWKDKKILSIFDEQENLIGGLVVSTNGKVQTEEYVFVNDSHRGKRLARMLHNSWRQRANEDGVMQHVAWIRDDNVVSIGLHTTLGYVKQDTYKIVMEKGI